MEEAVDNLEVQMKKADLKLDDLTTMVVNVEKEVLSDDAANIEVNNILQSVNDVKSDYQNLRKEILEVQDLQKQLSKSLQMQLTVMQSKFKLLKERISMNVPKKEGSSHGVPIVIDSSSSEEY